jgi:hypothetical protein
MQTDETALLAQQLAALKAVSEQERAYNKERLARIEQKLDKIIDSHDNDIEELKEKAIRAEKDISVGRYLIGTVATIATTAMGAWIKTTLGI